MQKSHYPYYHSVYSFIIENIMTHHDELVSCDLLHEDMKGNADTIFNIIFTGNLSFSKRNELHLDMLEKICNFCESSGFPFIFEEITVLLVNGR